MAIITTSKANADQLITALQAPPLPAPAEQGPGEGTGPGRPTSEAGQRQRRRGQWEYVPEGEVVAGSGEGGEVAPGVVESYEAGTAQWRRGQKPGVEEASAKQAAVASALASLHVTPNELPLSPSRVWAMIRDARQRAA